MTTAGGTGVHRRVRGATIVTDQFIGELMIGERHITILALGNPATHGTDLVGRVATAILKEDHLPVSLSRDSNRVDERRRKRDLGPVLSLDRPQVNEFDRG